MRASGVGVERSEAARRGTGIELRPRAVDSAALRALTRICPARCFHFGPDDRVTLAIEGCIRCGTCRAVCGGTGEIAWTDGSFSVAPVTLA